MTAAFSATVMVHSCVGVGLTAGHFVPRLRGNDVEFWSNGAWSNNAALFRGYRICHRNCLNHPSPKGEGLNLAPRLRGGA